jgi:hypothetical protein
MNKIECYKFLYDINRSKNVDISEQVRAVAGISSEVPESVVTFINRYVPQPQLNTFNIIHEKRHKNPLYKSLVDENLSDEDKAVSIASLLTQSMIGMRGISDLSLKESYSNEMMIVPLSEALADYSIGNCDKLHSVFNKVRNKFKMLYSD